MDDTPSTYLTPEHIARDLQVSTQCVRNWLRAGTLPGYKFGDLFRVRRDEYENWVASNQYTPTTKGENQQ